MILIRIFRIWFFVLAALLQSYFGGFLFPQCCVVASKLLLGAIILQWCLIYYLSYWWHCFIAFLGVVWVCHYITSLWREGETVFVNKNTRIPAYIMYIDFCTHLQYMYVVWYPSSTCVYNYIVCVFDLCAHTLWIYTGAHTLLVLFSV